MKYFLLRYFTGKKTRFYQKFSCEKFIRLCKKNLCKILHYGYFKNIQDFKSLRFDYYTLRYKF